MSLFKTIAGSTFGVSAAAPATFDAAGYGALTYTSVTAKEILEYQGPNPEWDTATDDSFSDADKADQKTTRSLGEASILIRVLASNTAFWTIIDAAELDKDGVVSLQFTQGNGTDLRWYTAQIKKAGELQGSASEFERREIMFLPQTDVVKGTV